MQFAQSLLTAVAMAAVGTPTWAGQDAPHQAHHLQGAASAPASKTMPSKDRPDMARMQSQMKTMHEMHDKMMAAKTPAERDALMADHMKIMQDGMAMMKGMSPGAMGGMGAMKGEMADRHQTMEARMAMMHATMQMMMDRLPAVPAK